MDCHLVGRIRLQRFPGTGGGVRHWLFSKVVYDEIFKSGWFAALLIFAVMVVIWFMFYGYEFLWNNYLRWYVL